MKYRFGGKEKRLTFGPYPFVSLSKARSQRDAARKQLIVHRDPVVDIRKTKLTASADAEATFEKVAPALDRSGPTCERLGNKLGASGASSIAKNGSSWYGRPIFWIM